MRRAGRRAWAGVIVELRRADASDIFFARLGNLAFDETGDRSRNAISHPMADACGRAAFGIEHQQRKTLGALGRIGPGERRRHVLADAIWIGLAVAPEFHWQPLAVLETRRR